MMLTILRMKKTFVLRVVQIYSILSGSKLGNYYLLNSYSGKNKQESKQQFVYLDNPDIAKKRISFKDHQKTSVSFYITAIH
jgi:hypothetical protein